MAQFIEIEGKKVNYEIEGNGDPFLFVHGWGGSLKSLKELAKQASAQYSAIRIELPGFGESDNPDDSWGVAEYAELVVDFTKKICQQNKFNLKKLSYFGHSFGGALGVYIAANYQDFIKNLVLCGASFKRSSNIPFQPVSKIKKLLTPLRKLYYKIAYPESDALKFPQLENNFRRIVTTDLSPELEKITTNTIVLWGQDDKETPVQHVDTLRAGLKNAHSLSVEIFPEKGHNLPLVHSEVVWNAIKKHMN